MVSFEIGQIINQNDRDYTSAAIWCNSGNGVLTDLGNGTSRIDAVSEPTQQELNAIRIAEIDAELDSISLSPIYKRAYDEMAEAMATGSQPSEKAKADVTAAAVRKQELRAERATLVGS